MENTAHINRKVKIFKYKRVKHDFFLLHWVSKDRHFTWIIDWNNLKYTLLSLISKSCIYLFDSRPKKHWLSNRIHLAVMLYEEINHLK